MEQVCSVTISSHITQFPVSN